MCNGESMGILAGINARRSCRAYQKTELSPQLLRSVLEYATLSPSSKNCQPWEVYVVTGQKLDHLRRECLESLERGEAAKSSWTGKSYSQAGDQRGAELAREMAPFGEKQGWAPGELAKRSIALFDAPAAAFVCVENDTSPSRLLDAGMFVQTLCLAATGHGLGSCIIGYITMAEPALRRCLNLPENMRFLTAVSLGFPDTEAPINKFESSRADLEDNVHFL